MSLHRLLGIIFEAPVSMNKPDGRTCAHYGLTVNIRRQYNLARVKHQ